jgi:spore coat protein U-like protein
MKTKLNQSKLKGAIVSAIVAGSMGLSATSYALTASSNMEVSTTVAMACTISAGALTFTSYDPTASADNDATATITSTCTAGGAAKITMSEGTNKISGSTTAVPKRAMKTTGDAPQTLAYHLYRDTDRTTVWGNTADTGEGVTGTGSAKTTTVFGRIPKSQLVGAGTFADTIAVTVTY